MRRSVLLLLVLGGLVQAPLRASEFGLLVDRQLGSSLVLGPGGPNRQEAVKPYGYGLRVAYSLDEFLAGELGVTCSYHAQTRDAFVQDLSPNPPQRFGSYKTESLALGAQLEWRALADLTLGADVRREHLIAEALAESTSTVRPWVRAGFGYLIPLPVGDPFIRLEGAVALTRSTLGATWDATTLLKSMAPRYQIGLYAGFHF